ncbi:MAG: hypothetical protein KatS3mg115_1996 [Candidatus Poribacteria bacterium]|nr:MAG: hypothetical protein KatS3mg115_1996 [Candidatus Poribacteria bacterium]
MRFWGSVVCGVAVGLILSAGAQTRFLLRTEAAGLSGAVRALENLNSFGYGAAFFDADGDGWSDLYVAVTERNGQNVLFWNRGGGLFEDVTPSSGIVSDARGVLAADLDNDGDQDLYLSVWDGPNRLYWNRGDGTFVDGTARSGAGSEAHTTGVAALDFDRDGWLDLYLGNYFGEPNQLYRNNGDGTFTEVGGSAGVADEGHALAVAALDADNDGWPDLFVGNDMGNGCKLYRNNGDGTFSDRSAAAGIFRPFNTMGVAVGDYDNDGWLDIAASDVDLSTLYRNNGDGTFTNVAPQVGLDGSRLVGWGMVFADLDNDGWQDLVLVNGNMPSMSVPNTRFVPMPDAVFHNQGDGTFREASQAFGLLVETESRGVIFGDPNRDGFPDLYITGNDTPGLYYLNAGNANHWLAIRTQGTWSNRDGIGARLRLRAGGREQVREICSGSSYLSCNEKTAFFGLGVIPSVERLEIRWPSGRVDRYESVPVDRYLVAVEGEGLYPLETTTAVNPEGLLWSRLGAVKQTALRPARTELLQPYPNPFNPEVWIPFRLAQEAEVRITLYDLSGRRVRTLDLGWKAPGTYVRRDAAARWDGRNDLGEPLPSGRYVVRLEAGAVHQTRAVVLRK